MDTRSIIWESSPPAAWCQTVNSVQTEISPPPPLSIIQGSNSLEKSLNFRGSPRKVLEFHFSLKILKFLSKSLKSPWIFFTFECSGLESVFWCFLVVHDGIVNNYESQLREFKGYLHKVLNVLCNLRQVNWKM